MASGVGGILKGYVFKYLIFKSCHGLYYDNIRLRHHKHQLTNLPTNFSNNNMMAETCDMIMTLVYDYSDRQYTYV